MNFKYTNKDEQVEAMVEFINATTESYYEYETTHTDAATAYLFDSGYLREETSYKDMYAQADDGIKKALLKAEGAGVKVRDIIEAAMHDAKTEAGSSHWPTNMIGGVPIGELEIHFDGLSGTVNGKTVTDILKALSEGLDANDLGKVAGKVDLSWEPGHSYGHLNTGDLHWWAIINRSAFLKDLKDMTTDAEGTRKDASASNDGWVENKSAGSWVYDPDGLDDGSSDISLPTVVLEDKGYAYYEQGSDCPNGVIDKEAVGPDVSEEDFDEVALEVAKEAALEGGYAPEDGRKSAKGSYASGGKSSDSLGDVISSLSAWREEKSLTDEQDKLFFRAQDNLSDLKKSLKSSHASTADSHQLKILLDTVKNPDKALLGGPSVKEAIGSTKADPDGENSKLWDTEISDFDEFVKKTGMITSDESLEKLGIKPEGEEGALSADSTNLPMLQEFVKKNPKYHIITTVETDSGDGVIYENRIRTVNRIQFFLGDGSKDSGIYFADRRQE